MIRGPSFGNRCNVIAIGVNVLPENRPPAIEAFSLLWEAEPDGSTIGYIPMPSTVGSELTTPGVSDYVTTDFSVIGIMESNSYVLYVGGDSEYEMLEDLQATPGLKTLNTERGSGAGFAEATVVEGLDLDVTTTYGAETSAEMGLAVQRGDTDFTVLGVRDFIGAVESGDLRPLLFLGTQAQKEDEMTLVDWLDDVPTWEDLDRLDLAGAVSEHRVFAGPPGMDPAILQALRDAFERVVESDEMKAWSEETGRLIFPVYGDDAQEVVVNQAAAMEDLLPILEAIQ